MTRLLYVSGLMGLLQLQAEGTLIAADGSITLKGEDVLNAVQFIRTTSTSASLKVAYGTASSGVVSSMDAI